MNVQELCWLLSEENFPSLAMGQEFINWCKSNNVDVLSLETSKITQLFREFQRENLNKILRK